jgi:predicted secreted protein
MTVITNADNNTTIELSKNERFVIQLGGGLKWSLSFDPSTGISRVPNSTTADGIQGVYEADAVGTTTLHATGAPICAAHEACPMLLAVMTATFVVH